MQLMFQSDFLQGGNNVHGRSTSASLESLTQDALTPAHVVTRPVSSKPSAEPTFRPKVNKTTPRCF